MPPEGFTPMQTGLVQAGSGAVGGLISGGFNALANYNNRKFNAEQAQLNRDWNSNEAQLARDFQLEMWNKQNAYDSPAAKMQRYIEAGLNPNLVYGELGGVGSPLPSVAQASGGSAARNSIGNPFAINTEIPLLQAQLTEAQIRRLENQNENDTKMTDANCQRFAHLNNLSDITVQKCAAEIESIQAKTEETRQGIENMKKQWEILDEKRKQEVFQTAFVEATQSLRIQGANAENEAIAKTAVALAYAKLLNVKADTALKWSGVEESKGRMALNQAQMQLAYRQGDLIASQINLNNQNAESVMWSLQKDKSYAQSVYGTENDTWFGKCVHTFTTALDCAFTMCGKLIHGTSVVHQ